MWPTWWEKSAAWRKPVLFVLGLVLLGAAIYLALTTMDWAALAHMRLWQWAALAAAVLANLLLTSVLFWLVTLSFDAQPPVRLARMIDLINASALLNYAPLRPGLIGRAAYLKAKHQLPLHQSVLIMAAIFVLATIVLGTVTSVALAAPWLGSRLWAGGLLLVLLIVLSLATGPVARQLLRRPMVHPLWWVPVRTLDLGGRVVRLLVAFTALGHPITLEQALILAASGMFVDLLGLTPNGLGLREWLVAGLAHALSAQMWDVTLQAQLLERGVEAAVIVPAGLLALGRLRRDKSADATPSSAEEG